LFSDIIDRHVFSQNGATVNWRGHDTEGNLYTLAITALGHEIVRVLLQRGAVSDEKRYQLASGAGGTLPYHSWMVDTGDEAWPAREIDPASLQSYLSGFAVNATHLRFTTPLDPSTHIYGLGERTGKMDKRGQAFPIWNVDPPMHHTTKTMTMYTSIPFYVSLESGSGEARGVLIDHVGMVEADLGKTRPGQIQFTIEGDTLAVYFFAGPTPADVLRQYSELTGRMPLPPRWALGHHQCRWGYESAEQVREVARQMRAHRHPCDALWLDIDYMDGFRNFTWNPETFPAPGRLIEELRQQGIRLVTIIDPGTKVEEEYRVYQEGHKRDYFCRYPNGEYFLGNVWPGTCVFPDFSRQEVREWWGGLYAGHVELGVAGIWNDMDEPALTSILSDSGSEHIHGKTMDSSVIHRAGGDHSTGPDGAPVTHALFHNAYGMQMARASYEGLRRLRPDSRPFVLTRSGTGGVQRYAAVWTGDNTSKWEYIAQAISMCLNLSMSGVPFVGMDIGGFWENSNGELLVRFAQLGALMPFCRNHNAKFTIDQEPWAFGEPFESAYRAAIELRYRALPYLYTLFAEAARTGAPVIRPLSYHYSQDERACQVEDQLLIGENLLSAPIYKQGASTRRVYLPAGTWFDYWTGHAYQGGRNYRIEAPLERWPLFVRANSIIPMGPLMQYTGERPTDPLTIHCYLDAHGQASFTLYEDDGETQAHTRGVFAETHITCQADETGALLEIEERFERYRPRREWYEIVVHLDGRELRGRVGAGEGRVRVRLD
jgi:alpha-glucosidase